MSPIESLYWENGRAAPTVTGEGDGAKAKGPDGNRSASLAADASRPAALLLPYIGAAMRGRRAWPAGRLDAQPGRSISVGALSGSYRQRSSRSRSYFSSQSSVNHA